MKARMMTTLFIAFLFLIIDYYVYQAVLVATAGLGPAWKLSLRVGFWVPSGLALIALGWWMFGDPYRYNPAVRNWVMTGLFALYFSKIFGVIVLFLDDITRGVRWAFNLFDQTGASSGG